MLNIQNKTLSNVCDLGRIGMNYKRPKSQIVNMDT